MSNLTKEQEEMLTEIHRLALSEDHLLVPYSQDKLVMANRVIAQLEEKLLNIAEKIQVVCGD